MIAWEAAAGPTAPPVCASEARPLGNRRRSLLRRAIATSRANATSIVCRDFRPNHTEQRAIAAPRAFNGWCDDEGVPLICPTCQVLPPKLPCRRPPATLHGVVFDIFVGNHSDAARESCLKPHTPARPSL